MALFEAKCYDFKNQGSIVRGRDLRLEGNQGEKDGVKPEMGRGELMVVTYSEWDRFSSWYPFLYGLQAEKGLQEARL